MRLGFGILCQRANVRPDGFCDISGGSQQLVEIDPGEPRLDRALVVQLMVEYADMDRRRTITVTVNSDRDEVPIFEAEFPISTRALSGPQGEEDSAVLERAYHLGFQLDGEVSPGLHRVVVACDGDEIGSWPFLVVNMPEVSA